jgi:hypothetical protein
MDHRENGIVAHMIAIIQVGNAHRDGSGESKLFRKFYFNSGHAVNDYY